MNYVNKEDINKYPLIKFNGTIHLIENENDLIRSCGVLLKSNILGFDTETKPAFKKGESNRISLLQLSADDNVFLFRINKLGFHPFLIDILSNPDIVKVGIDLKNDITGLKKIKLFCDANFIDLNSLALKKGFQSIGAVKLSIMLLGYRISKKQRLSDWSAKKLTHFQMNYAAIDAWICPKILQAFVDKSLYP